MCRKGWRGTSCAQMDHEARQCLPDCSGHGEFDLDTQKCVCRGHWTGSDCSKGTLESCNIHICLFQCKNALKPFMWCEKHMFLLLIRILVYISYLSFYFQSLQRAYKMPWWKLFKLENVFVKTKITFNRKFNKHIPCYLCYF